jgi:hypothetical protein
MMRTTSTARLASSLLLRANAYRFCINWAPLDPRKHNTMNHNPNNMYLDLYEYGHYPDWILIGSQPSKTYQPQVLSLLAHTLSTRYVSNIKHRTKLSPLNYYSPKSTDPGINSSARILRLRRPSPNYTLLS